jgi:hypothetical protein
MEKTSRLKIFIFPIVIFVLCTLLTLFKINGSSIGMYSQYFYGDGQHSDTIFGTAQGIRSDEWMVQTPWLLAQVRNGIRETNTLFGDGINFTTGYVPVRNWTVIFHPQYWAYFVLPIEYAFSWMWWFRASLLIISAYAGLYLISRKIFPSIALSLALFFSPFIQWWYSTWNVEIIAFAILIAIFFYLMTRSKKFVYQIIDLLILIYLSVCFAFELYPPFQIPIAICVAMILVGYLINNRAMVKQLLTKRFVISFILAGLIVILFLLSYYLTARESINIIRHTVYPGQRRLSGGGINLYLLFGGIYNFSLQKGSQALMPGAGNQCEISSFLLISLFLLPFFLYFEIKKITEHQPLDWIVVAVCAYMGLILTWDLFGLPSWLAKITLLNFVQPSRSIIGLGLINIFACIYFFYRYKFTISSNKNYQILTLIYALFISAVYAYISHNLRSVNQEIIPSAIYIVLISLIMGGLIYSLLNRYKNVFIGLFLSVSIVSTIFINPLQVGLKPILGEKLSTVINSITEKSTGDDKWVVYENIYLSNYLAANGAHVLTGTYLYPDLPLWHKLDPANQFSDIYNRYSHVTFSDTESSEIKFTLTSPDGFDVSINPCNPILKSLGVKYFVFLKETTTHSCLTEIDHIEYPERSIFIYESTK